ncbi:unnamed protein product [Rotaria magnacalcarata]|uniref:Uncharacterized protein n=1 Tax=Rotaria magnacalcarata TaxID=392030 RepID=A0A8S3HTK9_9BILA|nr:unnamed protein product [Rotaria magnacalcarata]
MSSVNYGNEVITSNDETTNPSGAIIQHPYLNPNVNVAYAAAAAVASSASSIGSYQNYYDHALPTQQLLHVPPAAGFYPAATTVLNHPHHTDFNNSSPSVASSSSSIESARKTTNRKRNAIDPEKLPGVALSTKANTKRKQVCFNHNGQSLNFTLEIIAIVLRSTSAFTSVRNHVLSSYHDDVICTR